MNKLCAAQIQKFLQVSEFLSCLDRFCQILRTSMDGFWHSIGHLDRLGMHIEKMYRKLNNQLRPGRGIEQNSFAHFSYLVQVNDRTVSPFRAPHNQRFQGCPIAELA